MIVINLVFDDFGFCFVGFFNYGICLNFGIVKIDWLGFFLMVLIVVLVDLWGVFKFRKYDD